MNADKSSFYKLAAKRFAASVCIYRVDAIVHVEDEEDIWFWRQVLREYRPLKYKFLRGSVNEKARFTTGCTQCLKYRDFLSRRFFICIDSDLRYLLDERISATDGILQTYTYSWENHCCFADRLQNVFSDLTLLGNQFDFKIFLHRLSEILYHPFLLMLYYERNRLSGFDREIFKSLISLQYRNGDEANNGENLLNRLEESIASVISDLPEAFESLDWESEERRYATKGLSRDNTYLFIRGHNIYNLLDSLGSKLCEGTGIDFEHNVLKSALSFGQYEAIDKIGRDVALINDLRIRIED